LKKIRFVVDENNRKMSKSIGNVIEPRQAIRGIPNKLPQCGLDVLRFWIAHEYYKPQIQIGSSILEKFLKRTFELRSILRFIVGNLSDLNAQHLNESLVDYESLLPLDKYMLTCLNKLIASVTDSYDDMNLNKVVTSFENFFLTDLSSFYIKSIRDRLYCEKKNSLERKSSQTTLYYILVKSLVMLGPIMPHLAEEAFCYSILKNDQANSLFRSELNYSTDPKWNNKTIEDLFGTIGQMRTQFFELIQSEKSSLYEINLECDSSLYDLLDHFNKSTGSNKWLMECFDCSQLNLTQTESNLDSNKNKFRLNVNKINESEKFVCLRCRKHTSLSQNELCSRCANAIASFK